MIAAVREASEHGLTGDECRTKKIGGRHRARVATSPQVQNRMVEILRMCTPDISNRDTAIRFITQVIAE